MAIKISIEGGSFENCGSLVKTSGGAMTGYLKCRDCGTCAKIVSNDIAFPKCASCGSINFQASVNDKSEVPEWYSEESK